MRATGALRPARSVSFTTCLNPDSPDGWSTRQTFNGELPGRGIKKVAVVSPAFASDCLETLEEINVGNREMFEHAGGERFTNFPCLNDNDDHIAFLEGLALNELQGRLWGGCYVPCSKRGEQLLGLDQVRCPEAFGERTGDGRQQIAGFGAPALLAPETGQAPGGAQLPQPRLLSARHGERPVKGLLGLGLAAGVPSEQQLGPCAVQLGLVRTLARALDLLLGLAQQGQPLVDLAGFAASLGQQLEVGRSAPCGRLFSAVSPLSRWASASFVPERARARSLAWHQ